MLTFSFISRSLILAGALCTGLMMAHVRANERTIQPETDQAGLSTWKKDALRHLKGGRPVQAVERGMDALKQTQDLDTRLEIVKQLTQLFRLHRKAFVEYAGGDENKVLEAFITLEFLELLTFETKGGQVTNAEELRWKVIGGVAPRTDVPTLDDIKHVPAAVYALNIIALISGEQDPILSAPDGRPVYHK